MIENLQILKTSENNLWHGEYRRTVIRVSRTERQQVEPAISNPIQQFLQKHRLPTVFSSFSLVSNPERTL